MLVWILVVGIAAVKAVPFGRREGAVKLEKEQEALEQAALEENHAHRAKIMYVVISSIDLPARRAYVEKTWGSKVSCSRPSKQNCEDFDVIFYDEHSPGVRCDSDVVGKRRGYACAQQRSLYALKFALKLNTSAEWIMIVDDDSFVNTNRASKVLGAIDSSKIVYAGDVHGCNHKSEAMAPKNFKKYVPEFVGEDGKKREIYQVQGGAGHALSRCVHRN